MYPLISNHGWRVSHTSRKALGCAHSSGLFRSTEKSSFLVGSIESCKVWCAPLACYAVRMRVAAMRHTAQLLT